MCKLVEQLCQIQETVRLRAEGTVLANPEWPCRKGCDDCCRRLAAPPRISKAEWRLIATALDALAADIADSLRRRIANSASTSAPVVCPLLDTASGSCLVYEARPVACRAYGFYAERQYVLGCPRIESIAQERSDIVWGNHAALEDRLLSLDEAGLMSDWLTQENDTGTAIHS
jgi:Fe-S-cluster containining protein